MNSIRYQSVIFVLSANNTARSAAQICGRLTGSMKTVKYLSGMNAQSQTAAEAGLKKFQDIDENNKE